MGDPISIGLLAGGLAASGGSIVAKQRAVKKAENKAAEAQAREAQRQREISQKAREKGLEALEEFDPEKFKKSEEEIVGRQLENVAKTLEKQPLPQSFKESSVPDVIVRESDKAKARGKKQASDFGESLARFGAQGLALQGANLRSKQTGFDVGRLARDSEISAMLAAQEIANARANTHSLFGEVLGGLGQFGISAGASGAFSGVGSGGVPKGEVITAPASSLPSTTTPQFQKVPNLYTPSTNIYHDPSILRTLPTGLAGGTGRV